MSERHLGPKTQHLLEERDVHKIVTGTVLGLMALYGDKVAVYPSPRYKNEIRALALMGRAIKQTRRPQTGGIKQDYHYAYTVGSDEYASAGIVIANARILDSESGGAILDRQHTMRQYTTRLTQERADVFRQDWQYSGKAILQKLIGLIGLTMEDTLRAPLGVELPEDDFVAQAFKEDMLSLGESTPVLPMTNLLHTVIDL